MPCATPALILSLPIILSNQCQVSLPPELHSSPECHDLLGRLLVVDPARRATVDEIYQHPWFLKGLPANALIMNDVIIQHNRQQQHIQTQQELEAMLQAAVLTAQGSSNQPAGPAGEGYYANDVLMDDQFESAYTSALKAHSSCSGSGRSGDGGSSRCLPSSTAPGGQ